MPIHAITNMNDAYDNVKCAVPQSEPSINDILTKSKEMAMELHDLSMFICSALFNGRDVPPSPKRDVNCARDAMMDICDNLATVRETLNYIRERL